MQYNFKRALGLAFLTYVATFIVGIVAGAVSGQDMSSLENIPESFWYVGMVAGVILTALFTMWYFRNPSIQPSAQSGFWFGLTVAVVSFALDFIIFSLGGLMEDLGKYYGDYRFWIIVVLVILTAKIVGHMKKLKSTQAY